MWFSDSEQALNAIVVILLAIALWLIVLRWSRRVPGILTVGILTLACMSEMCIRDSLPSASRRISLLHHAGPTQQAGRVVPQQCSVYHRHDAWHRLRCGRRRYCGQHDPRHSGTAAKA